MYVRASPELRRAALDDVGWNDGGIRFGPSVAFHELYIVSLSRSNAVSVEKPRGKNRQVYIVHIGKWLTLRADE